MGNVPPNGAFVTGQSEFAGVVASPVVVLTSSAGILPIPINNGPSARKGANMTSSITESEQTSSSVELGTATQEGRNGTPETAVVVAPLVTLTMRMELAGSRWGT